MSKFKKSQILMLSFLAALLFVTPLVSSSLRPKYLFFVINLLILSLGAKAGLLSVFSKPLDDRKHQASATPVTITKPVTRSTTTATPPADQAKVAAPPPRSEKRGRIMEKSESEKVVSSSTVVKVDKVKKCPTMPSNFFIGSGDTIDQVINDHIAVAEDNEDDEEGEEVGGLSGQELFAKAETFIGNFYKQLKMEREESSKKIHGFHQKAF